MLDEQVSPPGPVGEQRFDLMRSSRIDLTSLGGGLGSLSAFAWMLEGTDLVNVVTHGTRLRNCVCPANFKCWHTTGKRI
jgi:hypothetical protein